jgi:predicted DNA-binding transcriptional regulator YafY
MPLRDPRHDGAGPTARALLALEILQSSPGIRAEVLGERLGVTDRAARRYVAILREAGIPIESTSGRYGGYRVGRGLRLPPLLFEAVEAVGLVMAVLDGHHAAGDPRDPVGSALGKIIRALPESIAAQAELIRQGAAAAPDRSAARPDAAIVGTLVEASVRNRQVKLEYRTESGRQWVQEVDPWAVVIRHGRWYLLCWAHHVSAQRAYRIDRVRKAEQLEVSFAPPADLDPIAELEEHLGSGWEHEVVVEIDGPAQLARRYLRATMGRIEEVDEQTCLLHGSTNDPREYVWGLGRLPFPFRIRGEVFEQAARDLSDRFRTAAPS